MVLKAEVGMSGVYEADNDIKFFVVFGKWDKDDSKKFHILITNQLKAYAKTVIKNYLIRWDIEYCFTEISHILRFHFIARNNILVFFE